MSQFPSLSVRWEQPRGWSVFPYDSKRRVKMWPHNAIISFERKKERKKVKTMITTMIPEKGREDFFLRRRNQSSKWHEYVITMEGLLSRQSQLLPRLSWTPWRGTFHVFLYSVTSWRLFSKQLLEVFPSTRKEPNCQEKSYLGLKQEGSLFHPQIYITWKQILI